MGVRDRKPSCCCRGKTSSSSGGSRKSRTRKYAGAAGNCAAAGQFDRSISQHTQGYGPTIVFLSLVHDLELMLTNVSAPIPFSLRLGFLLLSSVRSHMSYLHDSFAANTLLLNANKTKCLKFSLPNVPQVGLNLKLEGKKLILLCKLYSWVLRLIQNCSGAHIRTLSIRVKLCCICSKDNKAAN